MGLASWTLRLRVRYGETDRMGRAYYARYFDWFTDGRTELIRCMGLSYRQLEDQGVFLPVLEAACRYLRPVDYDDELELEVRLERLTPTRMDFAYRLRLAATGQPVAEGTTRHAFIDRRGKPVNLRKARPEVWRRLEPLQAATPLPRESVAPAGSSVAPPPSHGDEPAPRGTRAAPARRAADRADPVATPSSTPEASEGDDRRC